MFKLSKIKYSSLLLGFCMMMVLNSSWGEAKEYPLNGGWKFSLDDDASYKSQKFDDSSWRTLSLPHDWAFENGYARDNAQGPKGGYAMGGIGWYRNHFVVTKEQRQNKKMWIYFDGVYMNSEVWINGHYLGKRPYGYISFRYDITPYLHSGSNTIAVRVDNTLAQSARWYHGCGIYGNAILEERNKSYFVQDGIFIHTPSVNQKEATVAVDWEIENEDNQKEDFTVDCAILSSNGECVTQRSNIATQSNGKTSLSLDFPHLWDVNSPYLYRLKIDLKSGGVLVDSQTIPFGVRQIHWDNNTGFWLNGRNLKIQGVCEHLEGGPLGAAWTENMIRWKIAQLKEAGCNAIRTAHNPQVPAFYDACDEMGMLVFDEAFDGWNKKAPEDYGMQAFDQWWRRDLSAFIRRDRNHPSIFLWSVGNETYGDVAPELVQLCHSLDSTRLVTSSWSNNEDMDILGGNGASENKGFMDSFKGGGKPFLGTEYPHNGWVRGLYHTQTYYRGGYPNWHDDPFETPSLTPSEIFEYAPSEWVDGKKEKFYLRSAYDNVVVRMNVRQNFMLMKENPWFSGCFRWTGFDYYGECATGSWPVRGGGYGILDFAGLRKDAFYLYQSEWTVAPMVHILPHWTHPFMKQGTEIPVMIYTTGDEVELFLNGHSLGRKRKENDWKGMAPTFMVPYTPGNLEAVAYRNGIEMARDSQTTSGSPARLRVKKENSFLTGNKEDLHVFTIMSNDIAGQLYPYGENRVYYHLSGAGEVISAENGAYWDTETNFHASSRRLCFGLQRLFVRNNKPQSDGSIVVGAILGDKQLKTSDKVSIDVRKISFNGFSRPVNCDIYYTTDGSQPTNQSTLYSKPFPIKMETQVKALVVLDGQNLFVMEERFGKEEGLFWGEPIVPEVKYIALQAEEMKISNGQIREDMDIAYIKSKYVYTTDDHASLEFYKENDGKAYKANLSFTYRYMTMEPLKMIFYNNDHKFDEITIVPKVTRFVNRWWPKAVNLPLEVGANNIRVEIESKGEVGIDWFKIQ